MGNFPTESAFIDIHSHNQKQEEGVYRVYNVFSTDYPNVPLEIPISIGLHPWHITEKSVLDLPEVLKNVGSLNNLLAFGETGLDSLVTTPMETQISVFRIHIECGIEFNKPLIIHCVKAFPELLALKKEYRNATPWIIHGFNANQTIATECVKSGIYISLSQRLFRNPEKAQKIVRTVPLSMVFAETDEDNMSVQDVYAAISGFYELSISEMRGRIFRNFFEVCGSNV
jgi:TatD DNase family protein